MKKARSEDHPLGREPVNRISPKSLRKKRRLHIIKVNKKNEEKRNEKYVTIDLVHRLAGIGCTNEEICSILKISDNLLYDPRYVIAIERGRAHRKMSLRHKQYQVALQGNVAMLIWLGKQPESKGGLGQKDSGQQGDDETGKTKPINININFVKAGISAKCVEQDQQRKLLQETSITVN